MAGIALLLLLACVSTASAQVAVPLPTVDPTRPNVFYGPPPISTTGVLSPVIVFVHGLRGTASDWWTDNTMLAAAFKAGFNTAFVSLNADNSRNDAAIEPNAAMLEQLLPHIAAHYGVSKMYVVAHSKGGLDLQRAMVAPAVSSLIRAVFTLSTPNYGTELADWAFGPGIGIAKQYNLLTPGVYALRTSAIAAFRNTVDPALRVSGVPFYTMSGKMFVDDPVVAVTGVILRQLNPTSANDGLVPAKRATLPDDYATDLGLITANHFEIDSAEHSFPRIAAVLRLLEWRDAKLTRLATPGFGDPHNTWMWSVEWFKDQLYVGTGREIQCISLVNSDIAGQTETFKIYPLAVAANGCPDGQTLASSLGAEIWRFDPATSQWKRVFKSPDEIFLGVGPDGQPWYTARDVGFRGMLAFREQDRTQALYVGGVTSGSMYDVLPQFAQGGYPPPRLLRSVDGTTFTPVPQTPGTFLGEIGNPQPGSQRAMRSFRGLTSYKGMLVATVGDFRGVGFVVASKNPSAGDNAWFRASPLFEEMPVWNIAVFEHSLYATTGDRHFQGSVGYGVYRTKFTGAPPYQWHPVIQDAGYANPSDPAMRAPNGLGLKVFKGQLYVSTDRPTELVRINPDDTWDLLVGEPRQTPHGFKAPLSGMGTGFGNWFNGHFWRMAVFKGELFLTTWDWSSALWQLGVSWVDQAFVGQFGFDLYRSKDGVHWSAVSTQGIGNWANSGGRSLLKTPIGLVIGTVRGSGPGELYICKTKSCLVGAARTQAPELEAAPLEAVGHTAMLSWKPVPRAVRYRVFRSTVSPVMKMLPDNLPIPIPSLGEGLTLGDIRNGAIDYTCPVMDPANPFCLILQVVKEDPSSPLNDIGLPTSYVEVGSTTQTFYTESSPSPLQSLYYVVAEDAAGRRSAPSNFVGAPSKAGY
jgi:pimeloyl-ACP methyl ester carboxylesterase